MTIQIEGQTFEVVGTTTTNKKATEQVQNFVTNWLEGIRKKMPYYNAIPVKQVRSDLKQVVLQLGNNVTFCRALK